MPTAHARNIALTPQLDRFIDDLVENGDYSSASEVVRDGLRELRRKIVSDQMAEIQARVAIGLDQLDRGEGVAGSPAELLGARLSVAKSRSAR